MSFNRLMSLIKTMLEEDGSSYCMNKIVSYFIDKLMQVHPSLIVPSVRKFSFSGEERIVVDEGFDQC